MDRFVEKLHDYNNAVRTVAISKDGKKWQSYIDNSYIELENAFRMLTPAEQAVNRKYLHKKYVCTNTVRKGCIQM
jgi:hypothetical protein